MGGETRPEVGMEEVRPDLQATSLAPLHQIHPSFIETYVSLAPGHVL